MIAPDAGRRGDCRPAPPELPDGRHAVGARDVPSPTQLTPRGMLRGNGRKASFWR